MAHRSLVFIFRIIFTESVFKVFPIIWKYGFWFSVIILFYSIKIRILILLLPIRKIINLIFEPFNHRKISIHVICFRHTLFVCPYQSLLIEFLIFFNILIDAWKYRSLLFLLLLLYLLLYLLLKAQIDVIGSSVILLFFNSLHILILCYLLLK